MYGSPFGLGGMHLGGMHLGYDSGPWGAPPWAPTPDPSMGYDGFALGAAPARAHHPSHPAHPAVAAHGAAMIHQATMQHQLAALQKQQALQAKAMTHLQPTEQTQVLPFPKGEGGASTVLAGAVATVSSRPQRPFQTQRFAWPSTTSGFFDINLFVIGQENMMVAAGAVSAETFAQTGVGVALSGYIAYPGIDITLQVTNTDTLAHPVQASIIGSALV